MAAPRTWGQSLKFLHYTIEDGLPSSIVYNGLQDKDGFLWFGTESGLARFDGTTFVNYTTENGLPANTVLNVTESRYGHLWISCYNEGLCYMRDGRVYSAKNDSTLAKMVFQNGSCSVEEGTDYFFAFDQGIIYRGTYDSVSNRVTLAHEYERIARFVDKKILFIKGKPYLIVWFGVFSILDNELKQIDNFGVDIRLAHQMKFVAPYYAYWDNNVFYTSDKQIMMYTIDDLDIKKQQLCSFDHRIDFIKAVEPNVLWVQVAQEGLYKLRYDQKGHIIDRKNIKGVSNVNNIFIDREGITWFCTAGNGIFALPSENNRLFTTQDGLPANRIQSLEVMPNDQILLGDANSNTVCFYQNKIAWQRKIDLKREYNRILFIRHDKTRQETWLATDIGILAFDKNWKTLFSFKSAFKSIYTNNNKFVFSGHTIALSSINKQTKEMRMLRRGEKITAITEDENQNLWLGKLNGLEVLRKDSSRVYLEKIFPDLLQTRITGLARANDNYIWVATHQNGVVGIKSDLSNRIHFSTHNGLSSNICQNIYLDGDGDIWVCTNNGLNKITRKDLSIQHFSTVNVLPDDDVNDVRVVGDTVWVATAGGLAVFIDDGIKTDAQYATLVSGLLANNVPKPIHHHALVRLPQDSCDLQFQFSALSFRSNGRFTYHYSIERVYPSLAQLTWDDVGHSLKTLFTDAAVATQGMITKGNTLQWSNTEVGRYRLNVVAVSFDKVKSALPDHLEFHVQPLFYQCLWFHLLCISLIIGLLRWLYIRQTNRNERDLRLQQELTSLKLEAFKAQINPHFVFNTINGIQRFFFPPDPAKANEYIVLFSSLVRKSIEFSEKTTLPFHMELEFLKDYLELTRLRVGERFEYHIEGDGDIPGQLAVPTMLLQPLVENAIVHGFPPSGKAVLKVLFTVEAGRCICRIEDNGIGINASKAKRRASGDTRTSKGTALVMQRVDALNQIERQQIRVTVSDKSDLGLIHSGTVAVVSFLVKNNLS